MIEGFLCDDICLGSVRLLQFAGVAGERGIRYLHFQLLDLRLPSYRMTRFIN